MEFPSGQVSPKADVSQKQRQLSELDQMLDSSSDQTAQRDGGMETEDTNTHTQTHRVALWSRVEPLQIDQNRGCVWIWQDQSGAAADF